ncbi:glycosyltransferase [Dactylosporangium sp. NPDC000555]|uniref:glycosyltransferase n=1 Tax=Dactylosporangium sp. NPDC000555 TaxID=3154260 RepID=UPI00332C5445
MQISVIIPAYNEEAGLGRTLEALAASPDSGPDIEIVVAANGCTDGTASVARSFGVRVLDLPTPSKTAALNAADVIATSYPRIYLDADIVVSPALIRALANAVTTPGTLAAVPGRAVDVSGSTWPVRSYYAINSRLPVFVGRLFGRGVIALSKEACERFDQFPDIIADDMFLDSVVDSHERTEIDAVVRVVAPRTFGDLVRRVARARAGNDEFWRWYREVGSSLGMAAHSVPAARPGSWLTDVVIRSPRLWPASLCYVAVGLFADAKRRRRGWTVRSGWGRPEAGPGHG